MYVLPGLPAALPTAVLPETLDLDALAKRFENILQSLSEKHLTEKAVWRDHFASTGTIRTFYGVKSIAAAWKETSDIVRPKAFAVAGTPKKVTVGPHSWIDIAFTFETDGTPATLCSATIFVVPTEDGDWKIWVLRTVLEQLNGQRNVDRLEPAEEALREKISTETDKAERANGVSTSETDQANQPHFDCVVIGGGQAGLSIGGRLKALGISYVIVEKFEQVGDNWATRYDSMKLHTLREYAHLPFDRTFDSSYPEFLTKDDLKDGYRRWAAKYDMNVWLSTTVVSGSWNGEKDTWTLALLREGHSLTVTCSFVALAIGAGGQVPVMPNYENREAYKGIVLHSADYKNAFDWKGKHGVVIGTANTAHDVAEDMLAADMASVTMVQRSKTYVLPAWHFLTSQAMLYNPNVPIEVADRATFTGPMAVGRLIIRTALGAKARAEPERFDSLERAGFRLDRQKDIFYYLYERYGGHYMDVGASAKISDGSIKVKSDSLPIRYTADGLECENGDQIRADVVLFATGFLGNMRLIAADMFGAEVAAQLSDCWGLDEEGELRGVFKPSGHPGLYFHGGAVGQTRYYSRFIALQIKAKLLKTPFRVYHHTPFPVKYEAPAQQSDWI